MADGKRRVAPWIAAAVVAACAVAAVLAIRGGESGAPAGGAGSSEAQPAVGATSDPGGTMDATAPGAAPATAAALLEAARAEATAGHYVQALGLYQRAHALDAAPSTLLQVGRMQHLSGRCREARRTTQRVLVASPPPDIAADAQDLLTRIGRCD